MFIIVFLAFLAIILLGMPLMTAMGLPAVAISLIVPDMSAVPLGPKMVSSVSTFTMLAVPFFMMAGEVMCQGNLTERLVRFCNSFIGHIRGGLAYVSILVNMILAGMSGAAAADVAASGAILLPAMDEEGYPKSFSGALLGAAGTMGPIIPPSSAFIIYGSLASVSVSKLFMAGVLPGVLMAIVMVAIVGFTCKKRGFPKHEKMTWAQRWAAFKDAILSLIMPAIILVSIFTGIASPTEGAAIALLYSVIVTTVIYKTLTVKQLLKILRDTMLKVAPIMSIVACAAAFRHVMAKEQIPQLMQSAVLSITDNKYIILLLINILCLFLGCFMEGTAMMLVTIPILLPIVSAFDYSLIQFGVMFVLNQMIGLLTPPVGIVLNLISKMTGEPVASLTHELVPYYIAFFILVLMVTYISGITLWLPSILS